MAKRILVTGGAGYIGCILCEHLLQAGYEVTVLDNLLYGQSPLFHLCADKSFEFVRGDVRDEAVMRGQLQRADAVVFLAALVGQAACEHDRIAADSVNVEAVKLLTRLRSEEQTVVFPVTNSGYGTKSGDVYCTEDTPLEPVSHYGQTKVEAEKILLDCPNVVTLRLATVFGMSPRMRFDLLVNHFVWAAVTDRYIVIFEKDSRRNYIHVRDVADCMLFALGHAPEMAGRPYNAGLDAANLSKEELALRVKDQVPGFSIHFSEFGSDPDKRDYIVSNQRLREAGFEAQRSLEEGIREVLMGLRMVGRKPFHNA